MSQRVFQPSERFKTGLSKTEWQLSHPAPLRAHPQVTAAWSGAEASGILRCRGGTVWVGNAELKGSSSRYSQFPRKSSKYEKHETREKGSERQEQLHPAEWEATWGVQKQTRELEGQGEWAFTSHRWMKRWSVTWTVVIHHSQRDSFSHKTVNHLHLPQAGLLCEVASLLSNGWNIEKRTPSRNEKKAIL